MKRTLSKATFRWVAEAVVQLTDPRALRAVAHPTRVKLLGELRRVGPLTATQAGERIDESPAGCSFHLRLLAKYGLVEEAGGGRGRARPWRATSMGHEWASRGPGGEPDEASDMLTRVVVERWFEEALGWAEEIASFAPMPLAYSKRALTTLLEPEPWNPGLDSAFDACWHSDDVAEAKRARAEKRAPEFNGR